MKNHKFFGFFPISAIFSFCLSGCGPIKIDLTPPSPTGERPNNSPVASAPENPEIRPPFCTQLENDLENPRFQASLEIETKQAESKFDDVDSVERLFAALVMNSLYEINHAWTLNDLLLCHLETQLIQK
jgi:hypothetical protein